jgi:hypothetical protein
VAELVEKLNAPIENPIQPNGATVKEYLANLAKAYDVEIVLDEDTFKAEGIPDAADEKLSFQAPKGIRLHSLLSMVGLKFKRDEDPSEGRRIGVLIRDGRLVFTTPAAALVRQGFAESDLFDITNWTPLMTTWVIAKDEPLSAVLRRMAENYEVNIVVASDAAKLAETRVAARLINVPLEMAAQSLADQCGLSVFVRHNVVMVMLPEKAKEFRKAEERMKVERDADFRSTVPRQRWAIFGPLRPNAQLLAATPDSKVAVGAENVRLRSVLADLVGAGFAVTIDPAADNKIDTRVTAKLKDVSCEAAVKQLAELAGLRAVRMDNSLFVTTPEKADRLAPPAKKQKPKKKRVP